jgi:hypothetical protein
MKAFTREQRMTIVYGILSIELVIVIIQLWLLTATMNAYLGGDESVILPAAFASLVCLALILGLLRYLFFIERQVEERSRQQLRS